MLEVGSQILMKNRPQGLFNFGRSLISQLNDFLWLRIYARHQPFVNSYVCAVMYPLYFV